MHYLPVVKEIKQLPRDYIANVIVSLKPDEFSTMVAAKMMERHKKYQQTQNVVVKLSKEVKEKILQS